MPLIYYDKQISRASFPLASLQPLLRYQWLSSMLPVWIPYLPLFSCLKATLDDAHLGQLGETTVPCTQ